MGCCGGAKSVLTRAKHIAIGYANLVRGSKYEFTDSRIRICQECEKNYWIGRSLWCSLCKCYIPAKARVEKANCPLGLW